jgi:hypothetical protein
VAERLAASQNELSSMELVIKRRWNLNHPKISHVITVTVIKGN